ncbi:MAG: DUF4340 domain-containing protein [Ruminococcus sp.]|nr:DUF4340 domain-containing protein [Ruminococcus sp.]
MNKTAKGLIALSGVLVLLGGGYAALRLTEDKGGESESSSSSEVSESGKEVIIISDTAPDGPEDPNQSFEYGVVKTVDVTNESGELHVVQKEKSSTDEGSSYTTYTLDGYQDIAMENSIIGTLANNANELTSSDVIAEDCTDLAKYGLESPRITADIKYESGKFYRMYIGDEAPSGDVSYVMIDSINTVYTVRNSALANYSKAAWDFVDTTVLASPDELPIVKTLKIERGDIDYDIVIKYDEKADDSSYTGGTSSAHILVEPTTAYLAVERSTDITTGMFGLSAAGIYSVHCTENDIAEAGLKDPFCTVTMSCDDGNEYTLLLSEQFTDSEYGKCYYGMLKGGNVIFIISGDKAQWATVMPVDIASKIFIASYVWNISDLSVECSSGEKAEFRLEKKDPNEKKDSYKAEDINTTKNGESFDSERFRQFYGFLISGNAESFALGEEIPAAAPMVKLTYTDSYTNETTTLEFYDKSAMSALIVVNGEAKFTVTKSFVETLIHNVQILDTDEEFKTTWK